MGPRERDGNRQEADPSFSLTSHRTFVFQKKVQPTERTQQTCRGPGGRTNLQSIEFRRDAKPVEEGNCRRFDSPVMGHDLPCHTTD